MTIESKNYYYQVGAAVFFAGSLFCVNFLAKNYFKELPILSHFPLITSSFCDGLMNKVATIWQAIWGSESLPTEKPVNPSIWLENGQFSGPQFFNTPPKEPYWDCTFDQFLKSAERELEKENNEASEPDLDQAINILIKGNEFPAQAIVLFKKSKTKIPSSRWFVNIFLGQNAFQAAEDVIKMVEGGDIEFFPGKFYPAKEVLYYLILQDLKNKSPDHPKIQELQPQIKNETLKKMIMLERGKKVLSFFV